MKKLLFSAVLVCLVACVLIFTLSCSMDFEQATVTYKSFKLDALPGALTQLTVNADVLNNDKRDADITKIVYTVTVEGVASEQMTYETPFTLAGGATNNMDMPLTFKTEDAAALLLVIKKDTDINYSIAGTMYASTPVGELELPLEITGTASVTVDFDEYFKQPTVEVTAMVYGGGEPTITTTKMDFDIIADITNNAPYAAMFKSAKYTVTLDGGAESSVTSYDPEDFSIAKSGEGLATVNRSDLTASFPINSGNLLAMVAVYNKVDSESMMNYTITGTMILNADIGGGAADFTLPLFCSGTVSLYSGW